jgi:hypothetical protein
MVSLHSMNVLPYPPCCNNKANKFALNLNMLMSPRNIIIKVIIFCCLKP